MFRKVIEDLNKFKLPKLIEGIALNYLRGMGEAEISSYDIETNIAKGMKLAYVDAISVVISKCSDCKLPNDSVREILDELNYRHEEVKKKYG